MFDFDVPDFSIVSAIVLTIVVFGLLANYAQFASERRIRRNERDALIKWRTETDAEILAIGTWQKNHKEQCSKEHGEICSSVNKLATMIEKSCQDAHEDRDKLHERLNKFEGDLRELLGEMHTRT